MFEKNNTSLLRKKYRKLRKKLSKNLWILGSRRAGARHPSSNLCGSSGRKRQCHRWGGDLTPQTLRLLQAAQNSHFELVWSTTAQTIGHTTLSSLTYQASTTCWFKPRLRGSTGIYCLCHNLIAHEEPSAIIQSTTCPQHWEAAGAWRRSLHLARLKSSVCHPIIWEGLIVAIGIQTQDIPPMNHKSSSICGDHHVIWHIECRIQTTTHLEIVPNTSTRRGTVSRTISTDTNTLCCFWAWNRLDNGLTPLVVRKRHTCCQNSDGGFKPCTQSAWYWCVDAIGWNLHFLISKEDCTNATRIEKTAIWAANLHHHVSQSTTAFPHLAINQNSTSWLIKCNVLWS